MDSATLFPRLLLLDRDLKAIRDFLEDDPPPPLSPSSLSPTAFFRRGSATSEPPPELQASQALRAGTLRRPSFASETWPGGPKIGQQSSEPAPSRSTKAHGQKLECSSDQKADEADWSPVSDGSEKSQATTSTASGNVRAAPTRKDSVPLKQKLRRMISYGKREGPQE